MIYFFIFMHIIFNIFLTLCLAAFVFSETQNKKAKLQSMFYMGAYIIIETFFLCYIIAELANSDQWLIYTAAVLLSAVTVTALSLKKKADLSIWIPVSIICSPIIVLPILGYIALFYKKISKHAQ